MKNIVFILFLGLLLLTTSCQVSSKMAMYGSSGRTSYNIAAQNTTNQELLLNLVRLRYSDTPYFLELNGITTQFNSTSKLFSTIKVPGFNKDNPASLGGELIWSNQPTIQYSPLEGKDFALQLMYPLDLRIIQGLLFTGWDVDRVFQLFVQNMADFPNATTASGPTPMRPPQYKEFFECLDLLRYFQAQDQLQIGVRYMPYQEKISDDEACKHKPNTIQISFPADNKRADRLSELLEGAKKIKGRYILNIRQAFNKDAGIGIMTRSLLGTMYYLSLGVRVPPCDISSRVVAMTLNSDGSYFNWDDVIGELFTIHWSVDYPKHAYLAVRYRGYWFYIDDSDVTSKRTFVLLQQVYNLQAKDQEKEPLLLTIPLGTEN